MTDNAEQVAAEASTPTKFSMIDRLQNRAYPSEEVSIYLAEDAAYLKMTLETEAATLRGTALEAINARITEVNQAIADSEVVVTIKAISSDKYDELLAESRAKFPVKYEKVLNPLTGRASKEELDSPDRESYFTNLFVAECLVKVTIGDEVDDAIDAQWFKDFQRFAPIDAIRVIVSKVFKMRMVTEWMDHIQDEDFSPRP